MQRKLLYKKVGWGRWKPKKARIKVTAHRSSSIAWKKAALFFCLNIHLRLAEFGKCYLQRRRATVNCDLLLSISMLLMRLPISSSACRTFFNISSLSASWAFCCRLTPSSRRSCSYASTKTQVEFSKHDCLKFGCDTDLLTQPKMLFPFRIHFNCVLKVSVCTWALRGRWFLDGSIQSAGDGD